MTKVGLAKGPAPEYGLADKTSLLLLQGSSPSLPFQPLDLSLTYSFTSDMYQLYQV